MPSRLESYVEELRMELGELPITQRAEQLVEVRSHLDTLKAANLELGLTEEEAEAAAIAQLGMPRQATRVERRTFWKTWCQGPFFAAHAFLTMGCLMTVVGMTGARNHSSTQMMTHLPFVLPMVLIGWLMGMVVGKRNALLAIPIAPIPPLVILYAVIFMNPGSVKGNLLMPFASMGIFAVPVLIGIMLSFRLPLRRRKLA